MTFSTKPKKAGVLRGALSQPKQQEVFVKQSTLADSRAEGLINRLRLLPVTMELGQAAREFADSWSMYLEVRDDVAALIFAQRRADALKVDVRDGDPAFQQAFERLRRVKENLDRYAVQQAGGIRTTVYRSVGHWHYCRLPLWS